MEKTRAQVAIFQEGFEIRPVRIVSPLRYNFRRTRPCFYTVREIYVMQLSIEEFLKEPEKYIELAIAHDIVIEKNGENVIRLTSAISFRKKAFENLLKLQGILSADVDAEKIREERLQEKYGPF